MMGARVQIRKCFVAIWRLERVEMVCDIQRWDEMDWPGAECGLTRDTAPPIYWGVALTSAPWDHICGVSVKSCLCKNCHSRLENRVDVLYSKRQNELSIPNVILLGTNVHIFKLEHVDVFPQCAAAVQSGHSRIMRNYLFIIQTIRHPPFVSTPQPWEVTRLTAIDSRIPDNNRGVYFKKVQENHLFWGQTLKEFKGGNSSLI